MKVRTEIRQRLAQNKLEWIRLTRWRTISTKVTYQLRKNRPNGLVSLSEHVQNYPLQISNKTSSNHRLESAGLNALEKLLFKMLGMVGEDI